MSNKANNVQAITRHIDWLIDMIQNGRMVLPDFQRDFNWSDSDVTSLLSTIILGWPAGSLLIIEEDNNFFLRTRSFEEGPAATNVKYIVLDGQQRLTSLYHAIRGVGPSVFAISWEKAVNADEDFEEAIYSFKREAWNKSNYSVSQQAKNKLIPISRLSDASDFFAWRDEALSYMSPCEAELAKNKLTTIYREKLGTLHQYSFPIVMLDSSLEPPAIASIFERVNRTGMKLSSFDLMVAKLYKEDWNLREKWKIAKEKNTKLEMFVGEDGLPILQIIALHYERNIRQSAVLKLHPKTVHNLWDDAISATCKAIEFLHTECGVNGKNYLPYQGIIILISALNMKHDISTNNKILKTWFWTCALGQGLDSAANTRLVKWYKVLSDSFVEHKAIDMKDIDWPTIEKNTIATATKKSGKAIWYSIVCLLTLSLKRNNQHLNIIDSNDGEHQNADITFYHSYNEELDMHDTIEQIPIKTRAINIIIAPIDKDKNKAEANTMLGDEMLRSQFIDSNKNHSIESFIENRIDKIESFLRNETDNNIKFLDEE